MTLRLLPLLALTMLTAACSSPPQAPTVDDAKKRPVNVGEAIELQSCRAELSATKIVLTETANRPRYVTVAAPAAADSEAPKPNQVYVIHFPLASAAIDITAEVQSKLAADARSAKFIIIRGRTDASSDSLFDTHLARRRAEAAYSFLTYNLQVPVPAEGIRTTWQGAGDPIIVGQTPAERQANRRVEIELYQAKPNVEDVGASAS